jgi:hypothetical protein
MTVIVGMSAKGAPGVSLAMWSLAHLWPRPVIGLELDESGGTWALRHGLTSEPGLASLAAIQEPLTHQLAGEHAHVIGGDHHVVCAPREPQVVSAAMNWLSDRLRAWPTQSDLLIDVGRMATARIKDHPAMKRADMVLCFARPRAEELGPLACALSELASFGDTVSVQLVLIGSVPYPPNEALEALRQLSGHRLSLRIAAIIPEDNNGANEIAAGGRRGSKFAARWYGPLANELAAASAHRPVNAPTVWAL